MKTSTKILGVVALLVVMAGVAEGAVVYARFNNVRVGNFLLLGNSNDMNAIANSIVADVDYDFASSTIVCTDSWAVTATGVNIGDPCFVGIGPRDGGSAIVTDNSVFMGIATAADTVKVRHCAVGTAANPADAGYVVRCFTGPGQ